MVNGTIKQDNPFDPRILFEALSKHGTLDEFYVSQECANTGVYKLNAEILFANSWTVGRQSSMFDSLPLIPGEDHIRVIKYLLY